MPSFLPESQRSYSRRPLGPSLTRSLRRHLQRTHPLSSNRRRPVGLSNFNRLAAPTSFMATRTLQPSEYDIQREVEALRDIRRRSTTPGALTIDPDLPNQTPPSSPTSYRLATLPSTDSPGTSHLNDLPIIGAGSSEGSLGDPGSTSNNPADDPFHLFWVPASLHPEIAPAEFRAFLKEHSRSPPSSDESSEPDGPNAYLLSSSSLGRKKSMLSRQYRPSEHDGVENEEVVSLKRNRSSLYTNRGPQLTINDLQKLEELAEEASESDDPSRLRNVLRRSLSMNISPSALDKMDNIPEMGDEADAPIIVPPPGQILRRAARTKIRKPGLPGDGGGHRFGSTRRGPPARAATMEPRTSSDKSSSDHGDSVESVATPQPRRTFSDEGHSQRPDSFNEEAIFDAYARDDDDETPAPVITSSPPSPTVDLPVPPQPQPEVQPSLLEALGPVILQPQPQRPLTTQPPAEYQVPPSRTPSPTETSQPSPSTALAKSPSPPSFISTTPSPPAPNRKDKDKKGLFGKWGSDKGGKKNGKEKDRVVEKEKDSGFFGSLFGGGSKKKQDQDYPSPVYGGTAGREAAQALLGASKSKAYAPSVSPAPSNSPNSYARYPIHVERAIYRLSHIKLANPRRPLYEQVLISNLMFWYLGVINKAQSPVHPNGQVTAGPQAVIGGQSNDQAEKEQREAELTAQRERAEKERLERERLEKEQRETETKKKESARRGSLTKAPAPGSPGNGRRAETPVKGPQYEMQHRVMEQEYGVHGQGMAMGRSPSTPTGSGNVHQYPRTQQTQFQQGDYLPDPGHHIPQQPIRIPPAAMAPVDQSTRHQSPLPLHQHSSPPPPGPGPRRSRSPPPQALSKQLTKAGRYSPSSSQENLVLGGVSRIPGRSLSATAGLPPANGKLRKASSAHSSVPLASGRRPQSVDGRQGQNGTGEEEDMPLAMWQQQHRR